jgi:DNA-binding XRE family transcriptional regulator
MGRKTREQEGIVANRLEQFRVAANLSRAELAEIVGVNYQTIGYIERSEYSPSLMLAFKLADALGTTVDNLFHINHQGEQK